MSGSNPDAGTPSESSVFALVVSLVLLFGAMGLGGWFLFQGMRESKAPVSPLTPVPAPPTPPDAGRR